MKILNKIFFKISYIIISMCFLTICKFHGHFLGIRNGAWVEIGKTNELEYRR